MTARNGSGRSWPTSVTVPKTALGPFFGTNAEPITAGRHAIVVTPSASDLPHVTSQLLVNVTTAGNLSVIFADDPDTGAVNIALPIGFFQLNVQVRAVTAARWQRRRRLEPMTSEPRGFAMFPRVTGRPGVPGALGRPLFVFHFWMRRRRVRL